jgi:hypothetical protein
MNLIGASICDEELIVQGEARDIQLPNTEHVSQISVDVSEQTYSPFAIYPAGPPDRLVDNALLVCLSMDRFFIQA